MRCNPLRLNNQCVPMHESNNSFLFVLRLLSGGFFPFSGRRAGARRSPYRPERARVVGTCDAGRAGARPRRGVATPAVVYSSFLRSTVVVGAGRAKLSLDPVQA